MADRCWALVREGIVGTPVWQPDGLELERSLAFRWQAVVKTTLQPPHPIHSPNAAIRLKSSQRIDRAPSPPAAGG